MSLSNNLDAVIGLHTILGDVIKAAETVSRRCFYIVVFDGSSTPDVIEAIGEEECIAIITDLQERAARMVNVDDPESNEGDIMIQVFEGVRWKLVRGRRWGLRCGSQFIPLRPTPEPTEIVDELGRLRLDPLPGTAPRPVEEAERTLESPQSDSVDPLIIDN